VRRLCVSRRQGCGLIPHLLIESGGAGLSPVKDSMVVIGFSWASRKSLPAKVPGLSASRGLCEFIRLCIRRPASSSRLPGTLFKSNCASGARSKSASLTAVGGLSSRCRTYFPTFQADHDPHKHSYLGCLARRSRARRRSNGSRQRAQTSYRGSKMKQSLVLGVPEGVFRVTFD
jgi:hypothetical protein